MATTNNCHPSEELAENLPPLGPAGVASSLLVEKLPVDLATTRVDVDLGELLPGGTLPEPASKVEGKDDKERKVRLEEAFGAIAVDGSINGSVEL